MTRIDPDKLGEQLSAYLDGELSGAERTVLEAVLREDPAARAELQKLRETAAMVSDLPRHPAPATVSAEVMARIERRALLEEDPATPAPRRWTPGGVRSLLLMAAMITIAVSAGFWGLSYTGQSPAQRELILADRGTQPSMLEAVDTDEIAAPQPVLRGAVETTPMAEVTTVFAQPETAKTVMDDESMTAVVATASGPSGNESVMPMSSIEAEVRNDAWKESDLRKRRENKSGLLPPMMAQIRLEIRFKESTDFELCKRELNRFLLQQKQGPDMAQDSFAAPPFASAGSYTAAGSRARIEEQWIQIPQSQLSRLVAALETDAPQSRRVTLSIGDLVRARGWRQAEQLMAMVNTENPGLLSAVSNLAATLPQRSPAIDEPIERLLEGAEFLFGFDEATETETNQMRAGKERFAGKKAGQRVEIARRSGRSRPSQSFGIPTGRAKDVRDTQDRSVRRYQAAEPLITVQVQLIAPAMPSPPPGEPGRLAPR